MVSADHAQQLLGARVVDAAGDNVGTVNEVYLDDVTSAPSWVTVATGWFGLSESFVPLNRAHISGDLIQVPFDKATIKDAPRFDGSKPLSPEDEEELYRHYATSSAMPGAGRSADTDNNPARYAATNSAGSNPDETLIRWEEQSSVRPGSSLDESSTRSEEPLTGGAERVRTGRARLRKYVVTEQQTVTVPVSHEEVRLHREPITDTDRDPGSTGVELTEDEREIVLHAERPVVTTESVPVERVWQDTGTVTEAETATGDIGHARVGHADDKPPRRRGDDPLTKDATLFGGHR